VTLSPTGRKALWERRQNTVLPAYQKRVPNASRLQNQSAGGATQPAANSAQVPKNTQTGPRNNFPSQPQQQQNLAPSRQFGSNPAIGQPPANINTLSPQGGLQPAGIPSNPGGLPSNGLVPNSGGLPSSGLVPNAGGLPSSGLVPNAGGLPSSGLVPNSAGLPLSSGLVANPAAASLAGVGSSVGGVAAAVPPVG
jgi:E1A/CREB-binding protein